MDQFREPPGFATFIARLEMREPLEQGDREAIRDLCGSVRQVFAHRDIISEGENPDHVHLILEGWAARYKILPDGGRQITAFLIPGDFCDAHVAILGRMDHGVIALTEARIAYIGREAFDALPLRSAKLARALWWSTLVDESVLRAWVVNVGARDAYSAVAHLLCELYCRMRNVGLAADHRFSLPITQEVIADALGLTPVHVNRVLQRLRGEDLIALSKGVLAILDAEALSRAAGFDPAYLHVRPNGA